MAVTGGPRAPVAEAAGAGPVKAPWTTPLALGPGAEPSIRAPKHQPKASALKYKGADPSDRMAAYVSAPAGTGSNFWYVVEKKLPDGSITFKPSTTVNPDLLTGGGDSEISVSDQPDPTTGCDRIAFSGLHNIDLLDNFTTSYSTDCGQTFALPNLFATQNTLTDRQWQTFDGAKTNFLIFHKVDTSQIVVTRSYDGGATYSSDSPEGARGIIAPETMPSVFQSNKIGNIITDLTSPVGTQKYPNGDQIHVLYAIFAGPRNPQEAAQAQSGSQASAGYDFNDTIYIAKSVDGGFTWTNEKAYETNPQGPQRELDLDFPVIASDAGGNLYAAWTDGFKIEYVVKPKGAAKWSKAYQVNPDNRGATPDTNPPTANIFPWIAAGADGKLDVVWYHASGCEAKNCNLEHRNPGDAGTSWTVAFAQLFDAANAPADGSTAPKPTVKMLSNAVTPVIHKGSVCNNGTLCDVPGVGGDRTLLDFFQVAVDQQGRANISYADDAKSPGSAITTYTRQNSGFSLLDGSPIPTLPYVAPAFNLGNSCPGPQVIDTNTNDAASSPFALATSGDNVDTLDATTVKFDRPDATHIKVTLTLKNLSPNPPPPDISSLWSVGWSYGGKSWYVETTSNGPGAQTYDAGQIVDGSNSSNGTPDGAFKAGPNGTITWTVDRKLVGNPPDGAVLADPWAETHGGFTVAGAGVFFRAAVDRAPDAEGGAAWTVAATCTAAAGGARASDGVLPATGGDGQGGTIGLLLVAAGLVLGGAGWRRRRSVPAG